MVSIYMLYRASLEEHQRRLSEMAQTHARMIEAVAEFDLEYSGDFPEGSTAATLSQVRQAHNNLSGFGRTGQFIIGVRRQGAIHAVVPLQDVDLPAPGVFPAESPVTGLMDQALNGHSGIGEVLDFRNVPVLAAYEPVRTLELGLVAKMDVAEIRGPFLSSMLYPSAAAVAIIAMGSMGFFWIGTPMLRQWERELQHFSDEIERRSAQLDRSNRDRDKEKAYRQQVETSLKENEDKLQRVQEELQASEHQLEQTKFDLWTSRKSLEQVETFSRIETAHIALDGHIQMVSPNLAGLLGYGPEDLNGTLFAGMVHPDETPRIAERLEGMKDDASFSFNMELRLKMKSGDWLPVFINSSLVPGPEEEPDHFLMLIMNQADQEELQREMAQARHLAQDAHRAKNLFISAMSHEIRTPLNSILGYAQIMLRDQRLDGGKLQKLNSIQKAGNQLLHLVNDVLDFSRIESGKMQHNPVDFDLSRQVRDLSGMFHIEAVKKGLEWKVENRLESSKVLVRGDQGKLRHVLISLLDNAVKFTEQGETRLHVSSPQADHYRFEVTDTGPGLSPEEQERIFESFRRTETGSKKGGMGLGLAMARHLVALMGGRLQVDSEPGKGARFHFTVNLPPAKRGVTEKLEPFKAVVALAPGEDVRAVVVDDHPGDAEMFAEMLQRVGVRVRIAFEAAEGVSQVLEWKPNIVFMDYKMPDMDGLEAFRMLRDQLGPDMIQTVIISASALDMPAEDFLSEGVHGYIQKPLVREEILEVMHRLLDVQYIYDGIRERTEEEDPKASLESIDLEAIRVPEALLTEMKHAARLGMFLTLDARLEALQKIEPHGARLAEYVKYHIDRFDKKEVLKILESLAPV